MNAITTELAPPPTAAASIHVERSLLDRARRNDTEAVTQMFRQFMAPDEDIYFAEHCGLLGFWIFGTHCFACLSNRRLASLEVGAFGRVLYRDGFLEHYNSGAVLQPSLLKLYVWAFFAVIFGLLTLVLGLAGASQLPDLLPGVLGWAAAALVGVLSVALALLLVYGVVRIYYALNKCGLLWWVREGLPVYIFTNRGRMSRANHLYRMACQLRDDRLSAVRPA